MGKALAHLLVTWLAREWRTGALGDLGAVLNVDLTAFDVLTALLNSLVLANGAAHGHWVLAVLLKHAAANLD